MKNISLNRVGPSLSYNIHLKDLQLSQHLA